MVDKKVGSAGIEITADDSAAMKVFKNIFNGVGKVDDVMKKFGETISFTITKSEELGSKTNKTTKSMIDTFNETKKAVDSVTKTFDSVSKSLDSQSKNTINNYKKTGDGIKDVNKTLSADTKQTFEGMKASNDDYNKNLIESIKYSTGEFKNSFEELKNSVVGMAKNIGSAIISAVKKPVEVIQSIPNAARTMGQKVTGFFASGFGQAKDLAISQLDKINTGINNIPKHARNASNKTKDFFVTGFNSMTLSASSAMSKTARFINELPSRTKQSANNLKTNFVQKIKDIPKSASEMATNVKDKFVSMSESARATGDKVKSFFSNSFNRVKESARESIDNSKNKIKELDGASDKASISIGKIAGAFGLLKIGTKIIGAITSSLDSAISRFDTMTKYPKVMQALGFGADQSKKSIDALSAGIDGLPTKLDDIVGINQRMISVSGNIDLATNATIGLNNAFLASGATTDEAARGMDQYIKMLATGKVEGDSWQTLMETMPVSLTKVANSLGYVGNSAMIDLQNAMQDGTVTFDQFQDKIVELGTGTGELAELAKINSEGIATSFGNLRNAIGKGVGNVIMEFDRLSQKYTGSTIAKHIDNSKGIINKAFESIVANLEKLFIVWKRVSKLAKPFTDLIPVINATNKAIFAFFNSLFSMDFRKFSEPANQLRTELYKMFPKDVADGFMANLIHVLHNIGDFSKAIIAVARIASGSIKNFEELDDYLGGSFTSSGTVNIMRFGNAIKTWLVNIKKSFEITIKSIKGILDGLLDVVSVFIGIFSDGLAFNGASVLTTSADVFYKIFESIGDVVNTVVVPSLKSFAQWMKKNEDVVKTVTYIIVGLIAAFKTYQTVMAVARGVTMAYQAVLKGAAAAQGILNAVMSANPIGLIVTAIIGVIAVITYLWKTNEGFRTAVTNIWNSIVEIFNGAWNSIKKTWQEFSGFFSNLRKSITDGIDSSVSNIKQKWQGLKDWFANLWEGMKSAPNNAAESIKEKWNGLTDWFIQLGQSIKNAAVIGFSLVTDFINTHFSEAIDGIKIMFSGLIEIFRNVFILIKNVVMGPLLLLVNLITGDFKGIKNDSIAIWNNIVEALVAIWQGIITFATGYFQMLQSVISTIITGISNKIIEIFTSLWTWIKDTWTLVVETIVNSILLFAQTVVNNFNNLKNSVVQKFGELKDGAISKFNELVDGGIAAFVWLTQVLPQKALETKDGVINSIIQMKDNFINKIIELKDNVVTKFNEIKDNIITTISSIDLTEIAKNIMDGLVKGITDKVDAVKDAVGNVADNVKGWFKEKLDIHSPSRVMAKISQWIPIGVAKGINDKVGTVKRAVQGMGNVVSKTFETAGTVIDVADPTINNEAQTPEIQSDISLGTEFTDSLSVDIPNVFLAGSELGAAVSDGIDSTAIQTNQSGNQLMLLLKSVLTRYFPQMSQTGRGLLQNIINGFNSLFGMAQSRAFSIGQLMVGRINAHQGNMRNAGLNLMNSLATGIRNGQGAIQSAIRSVNGDMINGISKGVNGVLSGVNFVLTEVGSEKKLPSWKIPAYANGTDGHPYDGPALVNDARDSNWQEAYQTPDGRVGLFPRIKNLIANLPKGTKVMNGRTVARMTNMPAYEDGVGDFDIVDLLDGPDSFKEFMNKRIKFDGVKEPWLNMSKAATKLMTGEAYGLVKDEMDKFFTHGSFDGAVNASGVYQYLVDVAQKLMGKFPGLSITSGYRPGDPYYHGKRQALDLAYPGITNDSRYRTIADYAFNKFPKQVGYVITLGKVRDRMGLSGTGSSGSWVHWPDNDHFDHVHLNGSMGSGDIFTGGGDTGGVSGSGVERWRSLAIRALKMEGQYSGTNLNAMLNQIRTESGGNPRAINNWDINAINGTPSKGLLQMIDPTFFANARPGFNKSVYDPLSNMLASIRYAVRRYGSLTAAYRGVGYENGGLITQDGLYRAGEGNKAEMVLPLTKPKRAMELIVESLKYMGMNGMELISNVPNVANNLMANMTDKMNSVRNFSMDSIFDAMTAQLGTMAINVLGGEATSSQNVDLTEVISLLREIAKGVGNGTVVIMDGKRVSKTTSPHTDKELAKRGKLEERGLIID